jgi:hypothetical protein
MLTDASSSPVAAASGTMASEQDTHSPVPSESSSVELITVLRPDDVLLGRGTGPSQYIGSKRFRAIVDERKEEYIASDQYKPKEKIAKEVLAHVHSLGGRFLKLVEGQKKRRKSCRVEEGIWCVVDQKTALEKCKQALREHRGVKSGGSDGEASNDKRERTASDESIENRISAGSGVAARPLLDGSSPSLVLPMVSSGLAGSNGTFAVLVDTHPLLMLQSPFAFQQRLLMTQQIARNPLNLHQFDRTSLYQNGALYPTLGIPLLQHQAPEYMQATSTSVGAAAAGTAQPADGAQTLSAARPSPRAPFSRDVAYALSAFSAAEFSTFTKEQEEMEWLTLTDEEKAAALSDMFGKLCALAPRQRKRARRDLNRNSIDFLIQQMRLEINKIPDEKKLAFVEAQTKCRAEEFNDARLERFLRCEGMNAEVCVQVFAGVQLLCIHELILICAPFARTAGSSAFCQLL